MRRRTVKLVTSIVVLAIVAAVASLIVVNENRRTLVERGGHTLLIGDVTRSSTLTDVGFVRGDIVTTADGCVAIRNAATARTTVLLAPHASGLDPEGDLLIPGSSDPVRMGDRVTLRGGTLATSPSAYPSGTPASCRQDRLFFFYFLKSRG